MKQFRYDISFLRAISVIFVTLYHFKFSTFKGGFIGVDIFFVISGFLMTKIILDGFSKSNFKIWNYYSKRCKRIIPPLIFTILVFGLFLTFILPTQLLNYSNNAASSVLFFSNIYYYLNTGYFDASSQYNFLLHTWSLSVEWQFYIIYPILLLIVKKYYLSNKIVFNYIFYSLFFLSLISMLILSKNNSSFSFYMFFTRAWEMIAGGIVFLNINRTEKLSKNIKNILFTFSILIICTSVYFFDNTIVWPSYLTLLPVISTALIIFLNLDYKIFHNKIVKLLGDTSYSLYLWHWPIYVISLYFNFDTRLRFKIIGILISFLLAIFTFYIVEKRNFNIKLILTSTITSFIILFNINYFSPYFFNKEKISLNKFNNNYTYSQEGISQYNLYTKHFSVEQNIRNYNFNFINFSNDKNNIILLGDSHAGMFSKSFEEIFLKKGINLIQLTAGGTFPKEYTNPKDDTKKYFNYIFKNILSKNSHKIKLVIINVNYMAYSITDLNQNLNTLTDYLETNNLDYVFIGQNDVYQIDFPTYYYLKKYYNKIDNNDNLLVEKKNKYDKFLKSKLNSKYIELPNINKINKKYTPYIYDTNHLTKYGTDQYVDIIINKIPF